MSYKNKTIIGHLLDKASKYPAKMAFTMLDGSLEKVTDITFSALVSRVTALATQDFLKNLSGQRVMLVYKSGIEFLISFLACLSLGIIPVPISFIRGKRKFAAFSQIISDSNSSTILCENDSLDYIINWINGAGGNQKFFAYGTSDILIDHSQQLIRDVSGEIAFLQYSSGSTGNPKGIVITHENLIHNQLLIQNIFNCNPSSIIFSWLPFHHDMGLIGNLLHTIFTGASCYFIKPEDFIKSPAIWLTGISKFRATHSGGPNFAYDLLSSLTEDSFKSTIDLSNWKVAYNGSEPISKSTLLDFITRFGQYGLKSSSIYTCYGLAEATLLVSGMKSTSLPLTINVERKNDDKWILTNDGGGGMNKQTIVSSGAVPPGMDVLIINPRGDVECEELEEGEICISGNSVTRGYWRKKVDNGCVFRGKKYLKTGDIGFFCNGELFVSGRVKEMLVIRGQNFFPYDIEQMVAASNAFIISHGVVLFVSTEGYIIIAEVKRNCPSKFFSSIIERIKQIVLGACGVELFDIILTSPQSIPRTTSGKLQRINSQEKYASGKIAAISSLKKDVQPIRTWLERPELAQAVLENRDLESYKAYIIYILESKTRVVNELNLKDSIEFADLGIDSLLLMEVINKINKDLGVNINAASMFKNDSVAGLIELIDNLLWLKYARYSGNEIKL